MIINDKNVVLVDVDGTLIKWVDAEIFNISGMGSSPNYNGIHEIDFYGMPKFCREITVHTEFLKSLKARGYFIRVHSGNGAAWAANVVKALKLEAYVDSIETKPVKVIDDKPCDDWIHPIYLGDK